jgi:polyhydroxyalkanoate synthesis regulator phasin
MTVAEPKGGKPASSEGLADRAGRIVDQLAKRGESRAKDIQKAARGIADRNARDRRDLMRLIQKEIRRQVETLGLARRTEVDKLDKRLAQLEGKPAKPTTKKPAAKKPASGKASAKSKKKPTT